MTHSLQDELYFSPVIPELQKALPYTLLEDFKDELKKKDEAGNLPRKVVFDEFVNYMDLVVNTLTFEINFSLNSGDSDVKPPSRANDSSKLPYQNPVVIQQSSSHPPKSNPPSPWPSQGGGYVSTASPQAVQCSSCPEECLEDCCASP